MQLTAISSAVCILQPHRTHAGANSREANTLAACSIGLSLGDGSRFTSLYLPTCPSIMCPSSCATVKRCRSGLSFLLTNMTGFLLTIPLNPELPSSNSRRYIGYAHITTQFACGYRQLADSLPNKDFPNEIACVFVVFIIHFNHPI